MSITVRVKPELVETFVGFYGNTRRRPGDVFELEDVETTVKGKKVVLPAESFFSESWMEMVDETKPKSKGKKAESATPENLKI